MNAFSYKFWEDQFMNVDKGWKQMEEATRWMMGGLSDFEAILEEFGKFCHMDFWPIETRNYIKAWETTTEDFQKLYRYYLDSVNLVPKDEHLTLINKFNDMKETVNNQEKEISKQVKIVADQKKMVMDQKKEISKQQKIVLNNKEEIANQKTLITDLKKEIAVQKRVITVQKKEISKQKQIVAGQKNEIADQKKLTADLKKEVADQIKSLKQLQRTKKA